MPDRLVAERPVNIAPERPITPKPIEIPKQPIGPTEIKIVQTIDSLGNGHTPDPDRTFQAILDLPVQEPVRHPQVAKVEETSAYKITIQTLGEKIARETDPQAASKLRQGMINLVAEHLPQLPDDRAAAFISDE